MSGAMGEITVHHDGRNRQLFPTILIGSLATLVLAVQRPLFPATVKTTIEVGNHIFMRPSTFIAI